MINVEQFLDGLRLVANAAAPFVDLTIIDISYVYKHYFQVAVWVSIVYLSISVVVIIEIAFFFFEDMERETANRIRVWALFACIAASLGIANVVFEVLVFASLVMNVVIQFMAGFLLIRQVFVHATAGVIVIVVALSMIAVSSYLVAELPIGMGKVFPIAFLLLVVVSLAFEIKDIFNLDLRYFHEFGAAFCILLIVGLTLALRVDGVGSNIRFSPLGLAMRVLVIRIIPISYVIGLSFGAYYWRSSLSLSFSNGGLKLVFAVIMAILVFFFGVSSGIDAIRAKPYDRFEVVFNPEYDAREGMNQTVKGRFLDPSHIGHGRVPEANACLDTGLECVPLILASAETAIGRRAQIRVQFAGSARNFELIPFDSGEWVQWLD